MLAILTAAGPLLVSIMVSGVEVKYTAWLPKLRLAGEKLTKVPTPSRLAVWGLPASLSETVTDPSRLPEFEGVKLTLMVQLPWTGTEAPQVLVSLKSPVARMLVIVSVVLPRFVSVICCGGLIVPTG